MRNTHDAKMLSVKQRVSLPSSYMNCIHVVNNSLFLQGFDVKPHVHAGPHNKLSVLHGHLRGTQRIVSVEYLFGRTKIASNIRLGKCHLELS